VPDAVARLIAMDLISTAWNKGGDYTAGALVLSEQDLEDWIERLVEDFTH
jgi:hypothetical protein